eukprot:403330890
MDSFQDLFTNFPFHKIPDFITDWPSINNRDLLKIIPALGLTATTYIFELIQNLDNSCRQKIVVKVLDINKRPTFKLDCQIAKYLSDQGYAPKQLYLDDQFRVDEYIDARSMGIFEMRNPYCTEQVIRRIIEFQRYDILKEFVCEYFKDQPLTYYEKFIQKDYDTFAKRIEDLLISPNINDTLKDKVKQISNTWVTDSFKDLFINLSPKESPDTYVPTHNDPQQGNILILNNDQAIVKLLDYEDIMIGPSYWDLASYLSTFARENQYASHPGHKFYPQNMVTQREVELYTKLFIEIEFESIHQNLKDMPDYELKMNEWIDTKYQSYYEGVIKGMILFNVIFGCWAVAWVSDEPKQLEKYVDLCYCRVQMYHQLMNEPYIKEVVNKFI